MYAPHLGRFMQTDLIGGTNLYVYVDGDPVGLVDPLGTCPDGTIALLARGIGRMTAIRCSDRSEELRAGGSVAWRNNNPGNMIWSPFSFGAGAIGSAHGFAVFPNSSVGRSALVSLLGTRSYSNLTAAQAIARYAPPSENNTKAYISFVSNALGSAANKPLSQLTDRQMSVLVSTIGKMEGWFIGTTVTIRYTTNSDGSGTVTFIQEVPGSRIRISSHARVGNTDDNKDTGSDDHDDIEKNS
jgi:hypothetical protein